jgi:protein PhnA
MARRKEQHQARIDALNALGKPLSRRARSKCELCGEGGPLKVSAVDGGPDEPDEDWALLLCERCRALPEQSPETLRFLETAVWSELVPAQVMAVRALRRVDAAWAREALDGLWLDDDVSARVDGTWGAAE